MIKIAVDASKYINYLRACHTIDKCANDQLIKITAEGT